MRVASVSYLNARPLIWGLDEDPQIKVDRAVPARLVDFLRDGLSDVALLPTIDYQRLEGLSIVPAGGIGCDGHTLTVRIFAKQPIQKIKALACDPDSHTSVALARIILADRHGVHPEFVDLSRSTRQADEALLLIGDKVVCEEPQGFDYQYDLGDEWKQMTGLPFVFAVWTARTGVDLGSLLSRLEQARIEGLQHVDQIVTSSSAIERGWPIELARDYLTKYLKFEIGPRQLQAIQLFHSLASKHGIIGSPIPLKVFSATA